MGWVEFDGYIQSVRWGEKVYTILPLPPDAASVLGTAARIEGEIDEQPVNLAVIRGGPIEGPYLWAGRSLLGRLGAEPGQALSVRLRPAPADEVETPAEIAAAFTAAGRLSEWDALRPGQRRGWIYRIELAKRPDTRAKRIAEVIAALDAEG